MANAAAEALRNLVVGPDGPLYGDGDGNGSIQGESVRESPPGLAQDAAAGACVEADVLGGSWDDPVV